jgi:hypothetical protein
VVVAAAATVASVLLRERSVRAEHEALTSVASEFAGALLTYDSGDLDAARRRVRPLVTDKFFRNYEATLGALANVQSKAQGRAAETMVGAVRGDRVAVVVVTESDAQTPNGPRANRGTYLRLDLLRQDGKWKVDQVIELAAGRPEGAYPPTQD